MLSESSVLPGFVFYIRYIIMLQTENIFISIMDFLFIISTGNKLLFYENHFTKDVYD